METKVLVELLDYLRKEAQFAGRNENFANLHHCTKIASHYRIAKRCYEDAANVLEFLASGYGLELLIGDD